MHFLAGEVAVLRRYPAAPRLLAAAAITSRPLNATDTPPNNIDPLGSPQIGGPTPPVLKTNAHHHQHGHCNNHCCTTTQARHRSHRKSIGSTRSRKQTKTVMGKCTVKVACRAMIACRSRTWGICA